MIDRDLINNALYYNYDVDLLFEWLESGKNTDGFIIQYLNETVLIYNTYNDTYLTWYKLTHVGRAFTTNIESSKQLLIFFNELFEDIKAKEGYK